MIPEDVNLYYLYISIPTGYKDGEVTGFDEKSVGEILDNQDFFELVTLEKWISTQFLNHINWKIEKPITSEIVAQALEDFENLGIKPENCTYVDPDFKKGNSDAFNEQI